MGECTAHWWRIAPAEGPMSEGICKNCNAKKHFSNSVLSPGSWYSADEKSVEDKAKSQEQVKGRKRWDKGGSTIPHSVEG